MKRLLLNSMIAAIAAFTATAQDSDLSKWSTETSGLPETVDGVKIIRPVIQDGEAAIDDLIDIDNATGEQIFVQSICQLSKTFNDPEAGFENIDYDNARFKARVIASNGKEGKNAATFRYTLALQATDGMMSFFISDININYKEKGLIPLTKPYAKLNIDKNKRHLELTEEFALSVSQLIDSMAIVAARPIEKISHWPDIKSGNIVKGMNPTEVILVGGHPEFSRRSGKKTKWTLYDSTIVVFNEENIVTAVVK